MRHKPVKVLIVIYSRQIIQILIQTLLILQVRITLLHLRIIELLLKRIKPRQEILHIVHIDPRTPQSPRCVPHGGDTRHGPVRLAHVVDGSGGAPSLGLGGLTDMEEGARALWVRS